MMMTQSNQKYKVIADGDVLYCFVNQMLISNYKEDHEDMPWMSHADVKLHFDEMAKNYDNINITKIADDTPETREMVLLGGYFPIEKQPEITP